MKVRIYGRIKKLFIVIGLCLSVAIMINSSSKMNYAASDEDTEETGDDKVYYTVTLDGNGKADTLWTYKVPEGGTLNDVIENSDDPELLWSKYFQEIDVDGKHYKVERYKMNPDGEDPDGPPFIILNQADLFNLNTPVTSDITIYAMWEERLDQIELTITLPEAGTEVFTPVIEDYYYWMDQKELPVVSTPEGAVYLMDGDYEIEPPAYWIADESGEEPFYGLIEAGKKYLIMAYITTDSANYYLSDDTEVIVTGGRLVLNCLEYDGYVVLETDEIPDPEKEDTDTEADTEITTESVTEGSTEITTESDTEGSTDISTGAETEQVTETGEDTETTTEIVTESETEVSEDTEAIPATGEMSDATKTDAEPAEIVTTTESDASAGDASEAAVGNDEPSTGDEFPIMLFVTAAICSLIGGVAVLKRKNNK